jgi:hypothetical protein
VQPERPCKWLSDLFLEVGETFITGLGRIVKRYTDDGRRIYISKRDMIRRICLDDVNVSSGNQVMIAMCFSPKGSVPQNVLTGIKDISGRCDFSSGLDQTQRLEPRPVETFAVCCWAWRCTGYEIFNLPYETDLWQKGKTVSQLSDEKCVVAGIDCGHHIVRNSYMKFQRKW